MNIRWLRDNLIMLILGLVFAGLLGGMIWYLRKSQAQMNGVKGELDAQLSQLDQIRGAKEYPSTEAIDLVKRDADRLRELYGAMQTNAYRAPVAVPDLPRNIDFADFMTLTLTRLSETATKLNVAIPEQFAYGFSRYFGSTLPCKGSTTLAGDDCRKLLALLGRQLVIVEKLCGLLFASKVDSIQAIRRTDVEPGQPAADALNVPVSTDPKALYQTYPFEIQFTCDTRTLRDFINRLAAADHLFIVRSLRVETVTARIRESDTGSTPTPESPAGEGSKPVEARRLSVTMRLDLIEFAAPTKARPGKS